MSNKRKKTRDALTILHNRYIKGDAGRLAAIAEEKAKLSIATQIYSLRQQNGLTQKELADRIGTTQSVISRLENTDYESERIETLQKLAAALHCHLELRFIPEEKLSSITQDRDEGTFQVSEEQCAWNKSSSDETCNWDWRECYGYELQRCG